MEMHQIRYFLAMTETLNFTRAAERCNVAPPSLIRAIKLLEAEFGGALFSRERQRTHLTDLGQIVLPYFKQIFESTEGVKTQVLRSQNLENVTLKLGVMCTIAPTQFLTLLSEFKSKYANVVLTIFDEAALKLQDALLAGELDAAVYALPGVEPDKRLHTRPLFDEEMVIVISKDHALAKKPTLSISELSGLPYVERINCEYGQYGDHIFNIQQVTGPTACRSERDDWVLGMVAQNLGYSFMPSLSAHHAGVVTRTLENLPLHRTVNLVTVRGRQHSPAIGAFVRHVAKVKWD